MRIGLSKIQTSDIYIHISVRALIVCVRNRHQKFIHVSPHSSLHRRPHIGKKGISNSFQTQIVLKILPVMQIISFTIMNYLKKFIWIKYLKMKQCPARLSPIIIPSPPVCHLLLITEKNLYLNLLVANIILLWVVIKVSLGP